MSLITEWRMTPQIGRRKSKRTHDFPKIPCWWMVVEFFRQNWSLPCSILVPNCSMAVAWILPSPVSCGYKRGHRNPTDRTPGVSCSHLLRVSYKEILLYPKRFLEALRVTHIYKPASADPPCLLCQLAQLLPGMPGCILWGHLLPLGIAFPRGGNQWSIRAQKVF